MAIVGTKKFSSALGLVLLMEAIAVLVGPPGAGQYTQGEGLGLWLVLGFNQAVDMKLGLSHNVDVKLGFSRGVDMELGYG